MNIEVEKGDCFKCPFFNDWAGFKYFPICGAKPELQFTAYQITPPDNCPLKTEPITVKLKQ